MLEAVTGPVVLLAAAVVLWAGLVAPQCTTRHCDDGSEKSVSLRNQYVVDEMLQVVGRLQEEMAELKEENAVLKENLTEVKEEVTELKKENAVLKENVTEVNEVVTELTNGLLKQTIHHRLGSTRPYAAKSCKQILDNAISADNGVYWMCASPNCTVTREVFCDMRSGGWTLIGQIGGMRGDIKDTWLVTNENTAVLRTPVIENGTYGCIDAVEMAVNYAHEVRLSSGENATGMGRNWVEWDLPADRDIDTFWRHSLGKATIGASTVHKVEVRSSQAVPRICHQNQYGMAGYFGGGYPGTARWVAFIGPNDVCMSVAVMTNATQMWRLDTYYTDAPSSNTDWPNRAYRERPPFVSVWLR